MISPPDHDIRSQRMNVQYTDVLNEVGISALPSGRRKAALSQTLEGLLNLFDNRVLPFDTDAARHYAELAVAARAAGKVFPTPDGYIGAIAKARGFSVATRDVAPFQAAGIKIIDPWEVSQ